jgi:hypothetical protein
MVSKSGDMQVKIVFIDDNKQISCGPLHVGVQKIPE